MITNDSDYEADDAPSGLLEGLEQLALALDAQQYPGPAWPLAPAPRRQSRGRRIAAAWGIMAGLATAAGIAWAAILVHTAPESPAAVSPAALAAKTPPAAGLASDQLPQPKKRPPVEEPNPAVEHVATAENAPLPDEQALPGNEFAAGDSPQVVVVEDLDSYSLIDMSGNSPVVSYMTKDTSSLEYPVPVPLGIQVSQGTSDGML